MADFNGRRPPALTIDRVLYQSRFFLNDYVHEMFNRDGIENDSPVMEVLQETEAPRELPPEHVIEIKRAIKDIIDAQEEDRKLSKVPPGREEEVTMNVARGLFDDGIFNWARVLGLFYLAYKICKKAMNLVGLFRSLINTIIQFMSENVINWIIQQGGWDGILDFVRRSTIRNALVFGGVAIGVAAIIMYNHRR
ncbi:hypothetical protein EGW08_007880 [Elysia chlorotica]|uniref:Bcl-2 Bcl-2 homology region 1-3 domain-containing protein n=1 Tax=Elysia chlorotica TaxID=188477 RepID=A0A3S1BIC3_ELYCH|nr:hypothetical protein EGW08_007880 [Elysia chlorotica]